MPVRFAPTRSKAALLGAGAVLATASVVAVPASSAAATTPDPTLKGLVLSGHCDGTSNLKNVIVSPKVDNLWVPLRFTSAETFQPLKRWIFPAEVTVVSGEGLKTRHLVPGETYMRPWPIPPLRPVDCDFAGASKEVGEFAVRITGTVVGGGALLGF